MRIIILSILGLFFCLAGVAPTLAQSDISDIHEHAACGYCGMDRAKWAHSRMLIRYEDGTAAGTCSLRCMAVEFSLGIDKFAQSIQVADLNTKELVDAEQAFWVLGGSKPGVMTQRAKWAFEKKADAEAFVAQFGGEVVTFDQAVTAAFEDMDKDTKMIRERRKQKRLRKQQRQQ